MKKLILILCICVALTLCFAACEDNGDNSNEGQSQNALSGGESETEEPTTEEKEAINDNSEDLRYSLNDDLIEALVDYLKNVNTLYYLGDTSYEARIDDIKRGEQPLLVRFDSERYYFVCGYYNATHQYSEYEGEEYCCATEYTWVKSKKVTDIQQYYGDQKLIVAFQINHSSFVKSFSPKSTYTPNVEHFQMYEALFENGKNVNEHMDFDETFIYLNPHDKLNVYCSVSSHDYIMSTLPCVEMDGEYYITILYSTVKPNEEVCESSYIAVTLGKYYDVVMEVMEDEKYSESSQGETVYVYGLFDIEKFMDAIFK
jgi:hypothetical protein